MSGFENKQIYHVMRMPKNMVVNAPSNPHYFRLGNFDWTLLQQKLIVKLIITSLNIYTYIWCKNWLRYKHTFSDTAFEIVQNFVCNQHKDIHQSCYIYKKIRYNTGETILMLAIVHLILQYANMKTTFECGIGGEISKRFALCYEFATDRFVFTHIIQGPLLLAGINGTNTKISAWMTNYTH